VLALAGEKLAALTGDQRFSDCWKFVREGRTDVYLQRMLDTSTNTKATGSRISRPRHGRACQR